MSLDKLRRAIALKKFAIGTEKTLKALKKGEVKDVFVSSNCPDELKERVKKYTETLGGGFNQLEIDNEELGVICKKPFSINMCYSY